MIKLCKKHTNVASIINDKASPVRQKVRDAGHGGTLAFKGDTAILYLAYAHKLCLCLDRREYMETALSTQELKYCEKVSLKYHKTSV